MIRAFRFFLFTMLLAVLTLGGLATYILFVSGDGGTVQHYVNGLEKRARSQEGIHLGDRLFLRAFYEGCVWYGSLQYPEGAALVRRVLQNNGQDLNLRSDYIVRHPDVKECLRRGKVGVIYGATAKTKREHPEYYYPPIIDYRVMYAFNPLLVKTTATGDTVCYWENYIFADLESNIKTPFQLGKVRMTISDGMMNALLRKPKGFDCYVLAEG